METCNVMKEIGIDKEGLLRVPGGASKTSRIIAAMNYPSETDWQYLSENVHSVASAMKKYLRDLPDPLLTRELYPQWANLAKCHKNVSTEKEVLETKAILQKMPQENFENLAFLIQFLETVVASASNKMNCQNVALVIGPNIFWQASGGPELGTAHAAENANMAATVCQILLEHQAELFSDKIFETKCFLKTSIPQIHTPEIDSSQSQGPVMMRRQTTLGRKSLRLQQEKSRNLQDVEFPGKSFMVQLPQDSPHTGWSKNELYGDNSLSPQNLNSSVKAIEDMKSQVKNQQESIIKVEQTKNWNDNEIFGLSQSSTMLNLSLEKDDDQFNSKSHQQKSKVRTMKQLYLHDQFY